MSLPADYQKSSRVRKLTEKGHEQYYETLFRYHNKLYTAQTNAEILLSNLHEIDDSNSDALLEIRYDINKHLHTFKNTSEKFIEFLTKTRTDDSFKELRMHKHALQSFESKVSAGIDDIDIRLHPISIQQPQRQPKQEVSHPELFQHSLDLDLRSIKSSSSVKLTKSHWSDKTSSSHQSLFMKQKAKIEAAKVRLKYAEREAEMVRKQAMLDAEKKMLTSFREVEVAEAEFKAMSEDGDSKVSVSDKQQRVFDYVQSVDTQSADKQVLDDCNGLPHIFTSEVENNVQTTSKNIPDQFKQQECQSKPTPPKVEPLSNLNPDANPYVPVGDINSSNKFACDLTKFIVKKDLLLSRLTRFDDKAEFFFAWKNSFQSVVRDLDVSPMEELDLLVKWLGPESSKYAISIRSANASNPKEGLRRIWERLNDRFASPEMVEHSLKQKINNFPKLTNKNYAKLFELSDIVSEIESVKQQELYGTLFAYYDSSSGVLPILAKLPTNLQERWATEATKYKKRNGISHPPFSFFVQFLRDIAKMKNDPSFIQSEPIPNIAKANVQSSKFKPQNVGPVVSSRATETSQVSNQQASSRSQPMCPFHKTNHALNKCRAFRFKPLSERKEFILANNICSRCCGSTPHLPKDCKSTLFCMVCKSNNHPTALHVYSNSTGSINYGGEKTLRDRGSSSSENKKGSETVSSSCIQICDSPTSVSKSCAKIVQTKVYPEGHPENSLYLYALIDDQSNRTLARSEFFSYFDESGLETEYLLSSCSGTVTTSGRQASGYIIESLEDSTIFKLPVVLECNDIPNIREEIPSPDAARYHNHLAEIAEFIPPINPSAEILILIGRDLPAVHHIHDQRIGPQNGPFAHKTGLGWTIVGEVCLGSAHKPDIVLVNKTHLLESGGTSIMKPCTNEFKVKERFDASTVFERTPHDDVPGLSIEDKQFLEIMDARMLKDPDGNWSAPLPFKHNKPTLPCNYSLALHRAKLLDHSLQINPTKRQHFVEFMDKVINKGHAEVAPPLQKDQECWYLPLFGVYSSKKPDQIRGVFDASAKYMGTSLNDVLLTGPDLTNNLLGILLRFRNGSIGVMADIEQMFYCFRVDKQHRDFLRFIWYKDNNPTHELIEYRMTVHVFGNTPSPAVATYGLRKSVEDADEDVKRLITQDCYVDDVLYASNDADDSIDLIKRTQSSLKDGGNIKLHKIASNSKTVLEAFNTGDLAKGLRHLDLNNDTIPLQKSLGMYWDIQKDTFTYQVSLEDKPFTRRGLLSVVNGFYDPIGFVSPVVIKGKWIFRELMSTTTNWNEPIPTMYEEEWYRWRESLAALESIHIPRALCMNNISDTVFVFSDASKDAIAAAAYVKTWDINGLPKFKFLLGKTKIAPTKGTTVPRLELCGAVLAIDLACIISRELKIPSASFQYYTDSKVTLGYIHNEKRRFYVYVGNRVEKIRRFSCPEQWHYVTSEQNPADEATRSLNPSRMSGSMWLNGPQFLLETDQQSKEQYSLIDAEHDKDLKPEVKTFKVGVKSQSLGTSRFERFSSWKRLVKAISCLQHIARSYKSCDKPCRGWHQCSEFKNSLDYKTAENFIIKEVQKESYCSEIEALKRDLSLPLNSHISSLSPYLDNKGILRVGGRLRNANLPECESNPIIIPKKHHISVLLVRFFHEQVKHQGRHFTEGVIRSAGFWIVCLFRALRPINS